MVVSLQSCKNTTAKEESQAKTKAATTEKPKYKAANTDVKFKDPKIAAVYSAYIDLKTELVNTDPAAASKSAETLLTALSNVGVAEETFLAAQFVVESKTVDAQREGFERVTAAIEPMIVENIEGGIIYKQYCPMAFSNKGAYWLSNSQEIYNPYFGDMMLRCGRVADSLQVAATE